jgi:hypothetical protein
MGKRPILVPRLARFGEAINDHQLMLARAHSLSRVRRSVVIDQVRAYCPRSWPRWSAPPAALSTTEPRLRRAIAADLRAIAAARKLLI